MMEHQRIHKPSSWTPSIQAKQSQFAPRPFTAQQDSHEDYQKDALGQNRVEAFGLQLKEKYGTITPVEQERLGGLQAKMNESWAPIIQRALEPRPTLPPISVHAPEQHASAAVQPPLTIQPFRAGVPAQALQPAFASAGNEGMSLIQRAFQARNRPSLPMPPIQAKLTIGRPNDKYEQEADRVASQVVQQINAPASAQPTPAPSIQRKSKEDDELQTKPQMTMRKPQEAIAGREASTTLASAINSARGGGQALDAGLQHSMGQTMGADFSRVRVHTDAQSNQLNQSIQAKAFTTGQDIFFRQGAYQPGSRGGQKLIAHELTHVVQQNGGAMEVSEKVGWEIQRTIKLGDKEADLEELKKDIKTPQYYPILTTWHQSKIVHNFNKHKEDTVKKMLSEALDKAAEPYKEYKKNKQVPSLYRAANLKFVTKANNRKPTLYFIKGTESGRLRQQHNKGPKASREENKKDYFFKSQDDLKKFKKLLHHIVKTLKGKEKCIDEEIKHCKINGKNIDETPRKDAFHCEITLTKDKKKVKKTHVSGGLVDMKIDDYTDDTIKSIYLHIIGYNEKSEILLENLIKKFKNKLII